MTEKSVPTELNIIVNIDNLTMGDLEVLDKAQRKETNVTDMLDLLDRVVEGGVRHLPLSAMQTIVDRIQEEVQRTTNPQVGVVPGPNPKP